ncbi:DUF805 domain-containing protein [Photobacterium halotolerans]|uniref:DUF805 domain-containing protein n=1 Tax=Photobacterium halotolerans TaxID=265726 RepID=UPI0013730BE4|nr:DUF805 domain-containing protein [Photobacterium halotolerans]NAW86895.1 DUF805 domain-containing protein [Photobacterium halotolerans]
MRDYLSVIKKYADSDGRARRREYWMFCLINALLSYLFFFIGEAINDDYALFAVYTSLTVIPSLMVTVRRLHDTNRSGWWMLVAFVPLIGAIIGLSVMMEAGTSGENDYGPDPKAVPASIEYV